MSCCVCSPFGQQLLPFLQTISGPDQSSFDQMPLEQPPVVQDTNTAKVEQPKVTATVDTELVSAALFTHMGRSFFGTGPYCFSISAGAYSESNMVLLCQRDSHARLI